MGTVSAANFALVTVTVINLLLFVFAVILEVAAFLHCLLQRPDAFPAVGTLSKGLWLALIGGALLLTIIVLASPIGMLGLVIGIIIAAVYLLDVRPAIRDIAGSSGGW